MLNRHFKESFLFPTKRPIKDALCEGVELPEQLLMMHPARRDKFGCCLRGHPATEEKLQQHFVIFVPWNNRLAQPRS